MAGSIMLLPPGDLEGLQLVGSGGFGLVYRGRSKTLSMEVALKMIQGSNSSNLARLMKDLKKERDVMHKASNPHVLRLIGVYEKPEGNLFEHGLVMEYMPYGSLRSLFDNIPDVPWALRFQILHQVALGMNYLHSLDPPIIHRDLKTSNVLLSKHLDVQITDFGLSKIVGATSSVAPSFAGTLSYMPPEALNDINYYPAKSFDVYSYGILTWTMFSCEEPYPGIPAPVIQRCVCEGQRPRDSVLDQYSNIRMVPEAKELMIKCWNQNAENRPSFHDCSESTSVMLEAYADEVVDAVRRVQDLLCKTSSQDLITETFGNSSIFLDDFLKDLKNAEKNELEETFSSVDEKTEEKEDTNDNMLLPSEVVEDDENISSAGFLQSNFAQIVHANPDLSEILDVLFSKNSVTQEELNFITVGSVQEQIRRTLLMIINQGPESCKEFLQLMNHYHEGLMRSLKQGVI